VRQDPRDLLARVDPTIGLATSAFSVALLVIVVGADYWP
jgi:hypothetical protein